MGLGGAILLGEHWRVLDPLAALIVSIFIFKVAYRLLVPCINELLEKSLPDEIENEIIKLAASVPGSVQPHDLRTRQIGNHYAIEMHIKMDKNIPLWQAHKCATQIEYKLKEEFGPQTHVVIHVEPLKENR